MINQAPRLPDLGPRRFELMAPAPNKLLHLSPDDVTLDAPMAAALSAVGVSEAALSAEPRSHCPKVQLVEGSTGGLTSQTECLLRVRLRAAALVLFLDRKSVV